ncbi:flagellar biosynthesis anti-sigma factor FlgM [Carnobacterium sp.]|uniref:flagellar biosynthesis anti-sigma factor FlgM n=1 Tax=Carnobacterium sp. TaxID=48221 RepID=UPI0028B26479|nr:flagellar biosynthesis anti-sigma factor FlgM [Carnobacterium sp.]
MKIGNGYNNYLNAVRQNQSNAQNKELSNKPGKTEKEESVQVNISDAAKQLAKTNNTELPSAKVEAIKKAVLDGTYEVSPEKISSSMLEAMKNQRK